MLLYPGFKAIKEAIYTQYIYIYINILDIYIQFLRNLLVILIILF